MASRSWGSEVNQKGLKGCAAEPERKKRGDLSWERDTENWARSANYKLYKDLGSLESSTYVTTYTFWG